MSYKVLDVCKYVIVYSIKPPYFQSQMLSSSPKPQSPRTCHIKKVCTFQVQQKKKKSVLEQSGSGDTER